MASGSTTPAATAPSYHVRNCSSGSLTSPSRRTWSRGTRRCPRAPPSRPKPEALTPPNGAAALETRPWLRPTMPVCELLADAERALDVVGVDVGHEAELGVVGGGDRRVLVVEADHGRDRAEDLLLEQPGVGRDAREHRRVEEVARAVALAAADEHLGALARGVVDQLGDLVALRGVDQRADLDVVLGAAPDLHRAQLLGQLLGELVGDATRPRGSGWRPCRPRRCCASWR